MPELDGLELDLAVALAMEKNKAYIFEGRCFFEDEKGNPILFASRTDPALLGEMLDWLLVEFGQITLGKQLENFYCKAGKSRILSEAVARAVVAAEKEKTND